MHPISPWPRFHSTSLHLRTLHILTTVYFPYLHLPSLHFTSLHFTSLHFTSLHCILMIPPHIHFALFITFLTLFLKLLDLEERDPKTSAGTWFQSWMVLFTKEYLPMSVFCFMLLICLSWLTLLRQHGLCNLSPIAFQARSPVYALKRAHMRAIFLRCVKVSQFECC
jgi:hypothetical protein